MNPTDLRAARKTLGLTQNGLAEALRMSEKNGGRSVRIWETEGNSVPGPVQVAVEYMLKTHCATDTAMVCRDVAQGWKVKAENLSAELKKVVPAIAEMMGRHVENWPDHKKIKTSIALIDKTLTALRDEVVCLRTARTKVGRENGSENQP